MTDLDRALDICRVFLANREKVRGLLLTYLNDGIRAQSCEQSRSTGHAIVQDPDGARPSVSDPTGEASYRPDGFRQLLEDTEASERRLMDSANRLIGHPMLTQPSQLPQILDAYRQSDDLLNRLIRSAAEVFRRALATTIDGNTRDVAGKSADGRPGCESCSRLKVDGVSWWADCGYLDGKPTDIKGRLKKKLRLCVPCAKFVGVNDRLPSVTELKHRHDDPRGHWPKRHDNGNGKAA